MNLRDRRAGIMAVSGDILTPVTCLIASTSPIDTGIVINNDTIMNISAATYGTNKGYIFNDGLTKVNKRNNNYGNAYAFGENMGTQYIATGTKKTFIIDGVNHRIQVATNNYNYLTATQFAQASNSMKLGEYDGEQYSTGYKYYYITAYVNDVLTYDLRPYLKNGKPVFYDVINGTYHTVAEGGVDWTYE